MIFISSDHAGFQLKNAIIKFLTKEGIPVTDIGPFEYNESDDYPDYIIPAAQEVAKNPETDKGIVIGGSGQGEAIAANKVRGVRAALYYGGNKDIITLSREHNNANVLSLGARFLTEAEAIEVVQLWLKTNFTEEERHKRRLQKIDDLTK
jgi:ribose 5-phosphate isomerase B